MPRTPAEESAIESTRQQLRREARNTLAPIREPKDPERKERCRFDLLAYINEYEPTACYWPFGEPHLEEIGKIQESVLNGGLFTIAMARGNGKTTLAILGTRWIMSYAHLPYIVMVGATQDGAERNLMEDLKNSLTYNDLLADDFDELVGPIRALENSAKRCEGQRNAEGEKTGIQWKASRIVTGVVGGACDEIVVDVRGLTSSFLGMRYARRDGSVIRPAFSVIDDPQTLESAANPSLTDKRLKILNSSVLGLADGRTKMAAVVSCTKMGQDCLTSRLLDQGISARWRGKCYKMVSTMPDNMETWTRYADIRADCFRAGGDMTEADNFYTQNRKAMDAGAVLTWEHRVENGDLSALQTAMNYWADDPDFFASEMQNEPLDDRIESGAITPKLVWRQVSSYERGAAPVEADSLVATVDCHKDLLYWSVFWMQKNTFTCGLVDYGTWPAQPRRNFNETRPMPTCEMVAKKVGITGEEGILRFALTSLLPVMRNTTATRGDGVALTVERVGVDAGWHKNTVYSSILAAGGKETCAVFGDGITAKMNPINHAAGRKRKRGMRGKRLGMECYEQRKAGDPTYVTFDSNFYKSFLSARVRTALGGDGCFALYKDSASHHKMIADHYSAERPTTVSTETRTVEEWSQVPTKPNHYLDNATNALALMSLSGAHLVGETAKGGAIRQRRVYNPGGK